MGFIWGLFGLLIIIDPSFYHSRLDYYFDFTEVKWPFGLCLIVLGGIFIWSAFRKKAIEAEDEYKLQQRVVMCPSCVKPFQIKDAPNFKCPICNEELDDLEGFYERHPNLRA